MIKLKDISKIYGKNNSENYALKKINIEIKRGETVAILGKSGSGKTTLLDIIGTILKPDEGSYFFEEKDVYNLNDIEVSNFRNKYLGFIFQNFFLLKDWTVLENVLLPFEYSVIKNDNKYENAVESLKTVGLIHKINSKAKELSGGEQQRVAIARAMILKPSLLLADEPTGNLDSQNSEIIIDAILGLRDEKTTLIVVTHNEEIALRFDRKVYLKDGEIILK